MCRPVIVGLVSVRAKMKVWSSVVCSPTSSTRYLFMPKFFQTPLSLIRTFIPIGLLILQLSCAPSCFLSLASPFLSSSHSLHRWLVPFFYCHHSRMSLCLGSLSDVPRFRKKCGPFSNNKTPATHPQFASGEADIQSPICMCPFTFGSAISLLISTNHRCFTSRDVLCFSVELLRGLTVFLKFVRNCFGGSKRAQVLSHVQRCFLVEIDARPDLL